MALTGITEVTAEWLTERLCANGYPVTVRDFTLIERKTTTVSTVWRLQADYTRQSDLVSKQLFLKIPEQSFAWGNREIQFYHEIAPRMQASYRDLPLIQCYDALYDPYSGRSHLLMEDLTERYFTFGEPLTPTHQHYEQVIWGFATIHACWYEHPDLGRQIGQRTSVEQIAEGVASCKSKLPGILHDLADHLTDDNRRALSAVADHWPNRRRERILAGRGITLVHRDPHRLNFLYPRKSGLARIIDWDAWRVDTGTDDLAYMMACHWDTEQRAMLESHLLRLYYDTLLAHGVAGYSWDDCQYDYQASIVRCLFFLMNAWNQNQQDSKRERIMRALSAFEQWRCAEIFNTN